MASSQLVWQLVKNNNSFLVKGLNGTNLSAEPGNLYNLHSYKYSGLANDKTVHIAAAEEGGVTITKSRSKNSRTPSKAHHSTTTKKHARRANSSIAKEVGSFRPDLKKAAVARMSALQKSQRVISAASKK